MFCWKEEKYTGKIPSLKDPKIIVAARDPTEDDTNHPYTYWISTEYMPYRVFEGIAGDWRFIGKFMPISEEK